MNHTVVAVIFVAIALISGAAPIVRTGDAHQYHAMAWSFATGHGAALNPSQQRTWNEWLAHQPPSSGFPAAIAAMRQPALIRGDHQEFSHFWVYPLLASPFVALADGVGVHQGYGFLIVNLILLLSVLIQAVRFCQPVVAFVLLMSPIIWFLNKAQVEVFTWALLSLAFIDASRGKFLRAALWTAIASTQNVPIAAISGLFWLAALIRRRSRADDSPGAPNDWRPSALLIVGALLISLVHPLYYLLRLGVFTPQELNGGIAAAWPTLNTYLAVLIDPDIGLLPWIPILLILVLVGVFRLTRRSADFPRELSLAAGCSIVSGCWLLYVFAQTTNLNSGGTPGLSRYGLWLLPLAIPFVEAAARSLLLNGPIVRAGAIVLVCWCVWIFNPAKLESYVTPSTVSAFVNEHLPGLYFQPPEVFFERQRATDGGVRGSAATNGCHVILLNVDDQNQPCELSGREQQSASALFAKGWRSVWLLRQGVPGLTRDQVFGAAR